MNKSKSISTEANMCARAITSLCEQRGAKLTMEDCTKIVQCIGVAIENQCDDLFTEVSAGVKLIAEKRARHPAKGWTAEHDDKHTNAEIAINAALLVVQGTDAEVTIRSDCPDWGLDALHEGDRIDRLAVAGSLIAAEIDRLQRLAARVPARGRK